MSVTKSRQNSLDSIPGSSSSSIIDRRTQIHVKSATGLSSKVTELGTQLYVQMIIEEDGGRPKRTLETGSVTGKCDAAWSDNLGPEYLGLSTTMTFEIRSRSIIPRRKRFFATSDTYRLDKLIELQGKVDLRTTLELPLHSPLDPESPAGTLIINVRDLASDEITKFNTARATMWRLGDKPEIGSSPRGDSFNTKTVSTPRPKPISGASVDVIESLRGMASMLDQVSGGSFSSIIKPLTDVASGVLDATVKVLSNRLELDDPVPELVSQVVKVYQTSPPVDDKNINVFVELVLETIQCLIFVSSLHGIPGGILQHSPPKKSVTTFISTFKGLHSALKNPDLLQKRLQPLRDGPSSIDAILTNEILSRLNPTQITIPDLPRCTPGTRSEVIKRISNWICSEKDAQVFWLHGDVSCGKTQIALTLSDCFLRLGQLGAHVFFTPDTPNDSPRSIVRTLAYQLATRYPPISTAVCDALQRNVQGSVDNVDMKTQFKLLFLDPLRAVDAQSIQGPVLLVLDGLGQYQDDDVDTFLSTLFENSRLLPRFIRILVTSRPLPHLRHAFRSCNGPQNEHDLDGSGEDIDAESLQTSLGSDSRPSSQCVSLLVRTPTTGSAVSSYTASDSVPSVDKVGGTTS